MTSLQGALILSVGLLLLPARAPAQIITSTGAASGLRMFAPNAVDWWLQPFGNQLTFSANGATSAPLLTILSGGDVGIGTTSPNDPLSVVSPVTTVFRGNLSLYDNTAVAAGVGGQLTFGGNYTGTTLTEWAGVQGGKLNASAGDYQGILQFRTRGNSDQLATRMTIDNLGNVGIGTTAPGATLDVGGGTLAVSTITSVSSATVSNLTVKSRLTVPDGANATDAASFEQIYYGFQPAVQAVSLANLHTTSASFQDTGLTASITPTSSSHRIKIYVTGVLSLSANNAEARATIARTIGGTSTNLAASPYGFAHIYLNTSLGAIGPLNTPVGIAYIDSPATTAPTTYTVQVNSADGVTEVEWNPAGQPSVMILEEIK